MAGSSEARPLQSCLLSSGRELQLQSCLLSSGRGLAAWGLSAELRPAVPWPPTCQRPSLQQSGEGAQACCDWDLQWQLLELAAWAALQRLGSC